MLGGCRGKEALLAIAERKSRFPCLCKVKDKKSSSIMEALRAIQEEFDASFEELLRRLRRRITGRSFRGFPSSKEEAVYASTTRIHMIRVTKG